MPLGIGRTQSGVGFSEVLDVPDGFGEEAGYVVVEELVGDAPAVALAADEAEVAQHA